MGEFHGCNHLSRFHLSRHEQLFFGAGEAITEPRKQRGVDRASRVYADQFRLTQPAACAAVMKGEKLVKTNGYELFGSVNL